MNRAKFKFTWVYEGAPSISKVFDINQIEDGCVKEFHYTLPSFMVTRFKQQFTGKKNNKGVDIYEGDIISRDINCMFDKGRINEEVMFQGCSFTSGDACLDNIVGSFDLEIIGNIYQNPELLESK